MDFRYDRFVDIITTLPSELAADNAIVAAWLFGSVARGTARATSDVDVAVLCDLPAATDALAWRAGLEARLSAATRREVQVVSVERAPADLVRRILRDGQLLVDRDRARRVAFEVRKRNEYFDMTPVWRRIRRLPRGVAP